MGQLDTKGFFPDTSPNESLFKLADTINQNKRYKEEKDYRRSKDQEGEDWRKLNLVQDLTDLSKHQTSSDVANAAGNQKAEEILQKYTGSAAKMSPAELQANIAKDMSGLIGGMDAMKNELDMSDTQLKSLKTQFPSLDVATLAKEHRADILHRRMDNNMNFINPMTVPQSQMDLNDPDFLSNYVTGNKSLSEAIINPKGVEDASVLMGNPDSHTTFTAKMPFWKQPNFHPDQLKNGYYNGKEIPQLQIKGSALPSDAMPSSNGKPFMMADKDVFDRFNNDPGMNMELTALTRKTYPKYDTFTPTEKEYSKRNVLYNEFQTLDQTNFHPTAGTKPARTYNHTTVNTGSSGPTTIRDVYGDVKLAFDKYKEAEEGDKSAGSAFADKVYKLQMNKLPATAQSQILKYANEITGEKLNQSDIYINQGSNGEFNIVDATTKKVISPIDFKDINVPTQAGIKEKRQVIKQGNKATSSTMVTMILPDGRKGQIPESSVGQFLKDNPKAKKQ